jgi:hypothetical protein
MFAQFTALSVHTNKQGYIFFWQMSFLNSCRLAQVVKHRPALNKYLLQGHVDTALRMVSKNTLAALRWTDDRGPRLTANWNSGERCTAARNKKRAEWKWQELLDIMMSLNIHLQQLLGVRYSAPTVQRVYESRILRVQLIGLLIVANLDDQPTHRSI